LILLFNHCFLTPDIGIDPNKEKVNSQPQLLSVFDTFSSWRARSYIKSFWLIGWMDWLDVKDKLRQDNKYSWQTAIMLGLQFGELTRRPSQ
jgi:hypothetical protein